MGLFEYDGEELDIPPTPNIVLERLRLVGDTEYFRLHRVITYTTTVDGVPFTYTVPPGETADFETDLASVPALFTWLVPKSGRHLPAALVHDSMVDGADLEARMLADRIFRDAMGDLDVGFIRRWVMWTAVSLETVRTVGTRRMRATMYATLLLVLAFGAAATVNLAVDTTILPWMGRHAGLAGWFTEVVLGLAGAVVIPIVLAVCWHPLKMVGVIAGVAIAVLFHVTVLIASVYGAYRLLEATPRRVQQIVGVMLVAMSAAVFAAALIVQAF